MFTVNDDNSIYVTRGDKLFFSVTAKEDGKNYTFQPGDVVRFKVYGKKDAENVVLQKDFPVLTATEKVEIYLTEEETRIGGVISKPTDYWYEVELNPYDNPQTIIGYDEDGAKVFKLFPEGNELPEYVPDPEDIPVVDTKLDMTSLRPVQNQAIARAVTKLEAGVKDNKEAAADNKAALAVERARIDNLVSGATADGAEVVDIRVGADGRMDGTAGAAVRTQFAGKVDLKGRGQISPLNTTFFDCVLCENCFDASAMLEGKAPNDSGVLVEDSTKRCTGEIEVDGKYVDAVAISEDDTTHWVTSVTFYKNGAFMERVKNTHTPVLVPSGATHVIVAWTVEGDATDYFVGFNNTGSTMAYSEYVPGRVVSALIKPEHLPQYDYEADCVDLFVFMGQSNMAGRGNYLEAPTVSVGAGFEFRAVSDPAQLYQIAEPFGANENVSGAINDAFSDGSLSKTGGMVTAFVNAYYKRTKTPIVAVSASEGGTDISAWTAGSARLNDAIQRMEDAVAFLEENNYSIRHKFVLWCQGESDGDRGTAKADYVNRFDSMLSELISHGVEKLFMVRIGNCNIADDEGRYTDVIKWQTEIAQENENVVMASTAFAGMRDRGLMKDSFHYRQAGYNEVGTYAGVNVAEYVNTGKEPTMYDTEDGILYYSHKN